MKSPNLSKASLLALRPLSERQAFLKSLSPEELRHLQWDWDFWGRPNQHFPVGDWFVWLLLWGRGAGKTRTAVENIAKMLRGPSPLIAPPGAPAVMSIVADSPFDMRQYTIEGPSGFLNVGPPEYRPIHEPSKKTLTWPNGAKALLFSAEDPESTRGASGSFFWWDELAKSRYAEEGWSNMLFGMREGNPRGIVTTTPRPIKILKQIVSRPSTVVAKGSTWDNRANLSKVFYEEVIKPLEGTRKGRQEIDGEILDDIPDALWTRELIDKSIIRREAVPSLRRIVVSVDPSGTKGAEDEGDSVGIVAVGVDFNGIGYVLADETCKLSPAGWGGRSVQLYKRLSADRIVAEVNFGGAMVESVIRTVDSKVPYKQVVASRGKIARAEPVAALYEQGKIKMVAGMSELEDQMCAMTTTGYKGDGSPDRVDAAVWGVTDLMLSGASNYTLRNV